MKTVEFGTEGQKFWDEVIGVYAFTPAETRILGQVCRTLDILMDLDIAIAENGVMICGSKDQLVCNPAITEARGQRIVLHRLISALSMPDAAGKSLPSAKSASATERWDRTRNAAIS